MGWELFILVSGVRYPIRMPPCVVCGVSRPRRAVLPVNPASSYPFRVGYCLAYRYHVCMCVQAVLGCYDHGHGYD